MDISQYHDVEEVKNHVMNYFGRIDVLVNNAGIIKPSLIKDMSLDSWRRVVDVNLTNL